MQRSHPCPVCSQENNSQEFLQQTSPHRASRGVSKGYSPSLRGIFYPRQMGKAVREGLFQDVRLKVSQAAALTHKGDRRAKKSSAVPSERPGNASGRPELPPLANSPAEQLLQGSASAAPRNHSPTLCLSFPAGKAGIKHHNPPRLLGRRPLSNCEAAGEYFLNKAAEFLPCAQMLW